MTKKTIIAIAIIVTLLVLWWLVSNLAQITETILTFFLVAMFQLFG